MKLPYGLSNFRQVVAEGYTYIDRTGCIARLEEKGRYHVLLRERSPFKVNHQHLIELKYAKKGEGTKGWEAKRQEGITQVQGYLQLPDVAALAKLSAWLLVTDGERVEAVLL